MHALLSRRYDEVKALLAAGVPASAVDAAGNSATHMAARAGDASLVKLLLRKVCTHTMSALFSSSAGRRAVLLCFHTRSGAQRLWQCCPSTDSLIAQLHAVRRA
jgi:ankyrin repeat protein